jgi:hypothetical protein
MALCNVMLGEWIRVHGVVVVNSCQLMSIMYVCNWLNELVKATIILVLGCVVYVSNECMC